MNIFVLTWDRNGTFMWRIRTWFQVAQNLKTESLKKES